MADKPPSGFLEILEAERKVDQQPYNIFGICTDYLEPAQSRGSDLTMKIQLWDMSCLNSPDLKSDGMLIRCFYKDMWAFPPIQEVGDVVIIRGLKTSSKGSQRLGMASFATDWIVISGSSLQDSKDPQFDDVEVRDPRHCPHRTHAKQARPNVPELKYAKSLVEAKDLSLLRGPPKSTAMDVATIISQNGGKPPSFRQKYCMLKDLQSPYQNSRLQFVDLIGEVRRVYNGNGNPVELQLTDYTEHPLLFNYPEDKDDAQRRSWVGPWGQRTITINAWDQHGLYIMEMVRKVEIDLGTYVRVNNVQIKMDKLGTLMQGHLRGGSSNTGTSITIHDKKDAEHIPELKDLIARKRSYNIDRKSKAIGFDQETTSRKRPADLDDQEQVGQKKKKTKSAKRKEKNRLEKNKENGKTSFNSEVASSKSNQHVRCEAVNIPGTSIASILRDETLQRTTPAGNAYHLPFQNCKYKSKVQVVDFFPDNLEDFAVPYRVSDDEILSDHESGDDEGASLTFARHNAGAVKWKWHFYLMVQDPSMAGNLRQDPAVMLVQASAQDCEYLLNMDACNLRDNPQELAKLREKMFVLWGDLEEKKSENNKSGLELWNEGITVSSKPFECLLKEYGLKARTESGTILESEWERMFAIFGTNIG